MFDMKRTGQHISELRKARNMTQLQLADEIGVSFQAVSNWERGNSMPDIAKLPELAELFGVTIDALLGESSPLLESAADNTLEEFLSENEVTVAQLKDAAAVLKPDQLASVMEVMQNALKLKDLAQLLPLLDNNSIQELSLKASESPEIDEEYLALCNAAPFMDADTLRNVSRKLLAQGKSIENFFPFLPAADAAELARELYAQGGIDAIEFIVPFLNSALVNELAADALQKGGLKAVERILPFLNKQFLADYINNHL